MKKPLQPICGVDFGTSNSVVALLSAETRPNFAEFSLLGAPTRSFRSLLFFDLEEQYQRRPLHFEAGPEGIQAYLEAYGEGRLIQSFKTHLTSTSLGRTQIGPHNEDLDGLVTLFLRRLFDRSEASLGHPVRRAVFGRPVHFAGAKTRADDERTEQRLRRAAAAAGVHEVHIEFEPIAAAYHYESQLQGDEVALIADFGAGTTDFCVMRIGPSRRGHDDRSADVLATGGVGVAGDNLDAALIQHVIAPKLGKGTRYHEFGRTHIIPNSYYNKLSRWHQLSFLRGGRTRLDLERLQQHADDPDAIAALIEIIEDNQGFHLHKSIERLKIGLSQH
ncbi:MAG TPA: Hsp70 family protein, partial [Nannocystis exedens]|nr:Hsp70 family protein [Nannocystis exedens]